MRKLGLMIVSMAFLAFAGHAEEAQAPAGTKEPTASNDKKPDAPADANAKKKKKDEQPKK